MRFLRSREKGKDPLTGAVWQMTTRQEMEQAERQRQIDVKNEQGRELMKKIRTALEKNDFKVKTKTIKAQDVVIFFQITARRPDKPHFTVNLQVVDHPEEPQSAPVLHLEINFPITPDFFNSPKTRLETILNGEELPELVEQSAAALTDFLSQTNDFIR
jgi:hypothetical protein